jgi:hypothetical protein
MTNEESVKGAESSERSELKLLVRSILDEVATAQTQKAEPAYRAELEEEKRRRESLEKRVNELQAENRRNQALAEAMERETAVKSELQKHGVTKVELAYKALRDDVLREKDGSLVVRSADGSLPIKEFIPRFLDENPELLPARNFGGSGSGSSPRSKQSAPGIDIDSIRPGMSREDLAKVRQEIARLAAEL